MNIKDKGKGSWGGPRTPGPGKSLGRPAKYGEPMQVTTIRLPPTWRDWLADDFGSLQSGVETLVKEYLEAKGREIKSELDPN